MEKKENVVYHIIASDTMMFHQYDSIICVSDFESLKDNLKKCLELNGVKYNDAIEAQLHDIMEYPHQLSFVYTEIDEDGEYCNEIDDFSIRIEEVEMNKCRRY